MLCWQTSGAMQVPSGMTDQIEFTYISYKTID